MSWPPISTSSPPPWGHLLHPSISFTHLCGLLPSLHHIAQEASRCTMPHRPTPLAAPTHHPAPMEQIEYSRPCPRRARRCPRISGKSHRMKKLRKNKMSKNKRHVCPGSCTMDILCSSCAQDLAHRQPRKRCTKELHKLQAAAGNHCMHDTANNTWSCEHKQRPATRECTNEQSITPRIQRYSSSRRQPGSAPGSAPTNSQSPLESSDIQAAADTGTRRDATRRHAGTPQK